jgi:hypothetical protein
VNNLSTLIEKPNAAERQAFQKIVDGQPAPAITFTREQLKLIKEALTVAEGSLFGRSLDLGQLADDADRAGKKTRFRARADELFCKSCDCRDLSEKVAKALGGRV